MTCFTSETHPESGSTTYTYDDNGNVISKTDARGLITTNEYDALNRVTKTRYSDSTLWSFFSYDETSTTLIASITNGKGRRTSTWTLNSTGQVVAESVGYSWSYDVVGRVVQQVAQIDNTSYPVTYNYTASGCGCPTKDLQSMTYPGNFQVNYTRDSIGRVLGISKPNPVLDRDWYVRAVEYDSPHGAPSLVRFGNSYDDLFSYDAIGRIRQLLVRNSSYPYVLWTYSYNGSGRISEIKEGRRVSEAPSTTSRFNHSYDELGRLTSDVSSTTTDDVHWTTDWTNSFTYDRYANMLTNVLAPGGTTTLAVNAANNRLSSYTTSQGTTNVSYDLGREYDHRRREELYF